MIDLDDFKLYNDTWGHDAGDAVLRTLVQMLRNCVRDEDSIIRYGGDEFLLLMPDISQAQFEESLRRVKEKVCDADVPGYTNLRLSVSIGGVLSDGNVIISKCTLCSCQVNLRKTDNWNDSNIMVLCTLFLSSCKRPEVLDHSTLVHSARNVALTFGPAYVPFF